MANQEQLNILKQGIETWNTWRGEHRDIRPDLNKADLSFANLSRANLNDADLSFADLREAHLEQADLRRADLSEANLCKSNLTGANLSDAHLVQANLTRAKLIGALLAEAFVFDANLSLANLSGADFEQAVLRDARLDKAGLIGTFFHRADLSRADLRGANLTGAYLMFANLEEADLSEANLEEAYLKGANLERANLYGTNLERAVLVDTDLTGAILTRCSIYGISAWNVKLEGAKQDNLVITPRGEPIITVDNLKVAQFIYLLLNNKDIRDVINTITTKVVLILGRFTPERKAILDAIRDELRRRDYLPILFDFEKPNSLNFTETVRTLAHLARFIIADLTDPSSIPQELQAIVPNRAVPVQPILLKGKKEYSMFVDFFRFPWVLPVYLYQDQPSLLASLNEHVIEPAEQKAQELEKR